MSSKKQKQTSETFVLGALLALSGGFQDAYTYNVRDEVFSNAQTGNVVLMSQHFMTGDFAVALQYLFPILAFAGGVFVADRLHQHFQNSRRFHWRQIVVLWEILILLMVGFIPTTYNMIATMLVSFSCSMQVQAFRKINGYGYASTMCIIKMIHYYGIILVFALGAGLGGVASHYIGISAIWSCAVLLTIGFILMFKEKI